MLTGSLSSLCILTGITCVCLLLALDISDMGKLNSQGLETSVTKVLQARLPSVDING